MSDWLTEQLFKSRATYGQAPISTGVAATPLPDSNPVIPNTPYSIPDHYSTPTTAPAAMTSSTAPAAVPSSTASAAAPSPMTSSTASAAAPSPMTSSAAPAATPLKPASRDPVQAIRDIAAEEIPADKYMLYALNIGSTNDKAEYYRLTIALSDFVFFNLRRAFATRRINALAWKTAREALMASGFFPTGCSGYAMRVDEASREGIAAETTSTDAAVRTVLQARDTLGESNPELAEELTHSLETLGVIKSQSSVDETIQALVEDGVPLDPSEHKSRVRQFIDEFQRFSVLSEDGATLMERYEDLAKQWFGVVKGNEIGFSIMSMCTKRDGESEESFKTRYREHAVELTKKLGSRLSGHPQLSRLSLHPCIFGEVMPIGYVPVDEMVGIDGKGVARSIFSVAPQLPAMTDDQPLIGTRQ